MNDTLFFIAPGEEAMTYQVLKGVEYLKAQRCSMKETQDSIRDNQSHVWLSDEL